MIDVIVEVKSQNKTVAIVRTVRRRLENGREVARDRNRRIAAAVAEAAVVVIDIVDDTTRVVDPRLVHDLDHDEASRKQHEIEQQLARKKPRTDLVMDKMVIIISEIVWKNSI